MATVINNKALMTVSSKFDHAELIGSHYFGIDAKVKKKRLKTRPPPPPSSGQSFRASIR